MKQVYIRIETDGFSLTLLGDHPGDDELVKRQWSTLEPPHYLDPDDGRAVLVPATLENLRYHRPHDPGGLLGWALAQDLARLIVGHLEKRVSYGELRVAMEGWEEVTSLLPQQAPADQWEFLNSLFE